MRATLLVCALVILVLLGVNAPAQEAPTMAALRDEMARSMGELRMKGEAPPYFIAYEVLDRTISDYSGRLGALVENPPRRTRTLRVEVRVGDYNFDSSRFVVQGFGGGAGLSGETVIAPLDDDYDAMRREIWMTTDSAYKRAISMFARKKAAFQNRTSSEPLPDFRKRAPVEVALPLLQVPDANARREAVRRVQQDFGGIPPRRPKSMSRMLASAESPASRTTLNSEGSRTVTPIQIAALSMFGEAQAGDGMPCARPSASSNARFRTCRRPRIQ